MSFSDSCAGIVMAGGGPDGPWVCGVVCVCVWCVCVRCVCVTFSPITPISDKWVFHTYCLTLQWRHNGRDSVSNHQPHDCFLNRLFRHRSQKTSKLRVTDLCAGNSPEAGEFPAQMASNTENVSIWWRHHELETRGSGSHNIQFWNWNCDSIPISVLELVKLEIYGTEIEPLGIGMKIMWMELKFLAVAKQLYEWFSPSLRLFVHQIFGSYNWGVGVLVMWTSLGMCCPQGSLFEPNFHSQGSIFG